MRYLSREQVRQIDRLAIEQYGVPGIVLMENAARGVADEAIRMLGAPAEAPPRVLLLCGGGNNGGDGLAVARHLHNHGFEVHIGLTTDPARYAGDALVNWRIVQAMRMPCSEASPDVLLRIDPQLIIDAIFGTGLNRPPQDPFPALADAVNALGRPILAVDLPSGLDCDTGRPPGSCIRATRTVTFVALKQGFSNPESSGWTGPVTVADIGCPKELLVLKWSDVRGRATEPLAGEDAQEWVSRTRREADEEREGRP